MVTKRSRIDRAEESGSVIVLVALSLVALFAFAALSIDLSHVYQQERDLQSATDAAALSAAILLTNPVCCGVTAQSVIDRATAVALANGVTNTEIDGSIQVGHWDTNSATFNPSAAQANWNAVRVPARRSVALAFGPIIGMGHMSPGAHSIAMSGGLGSAEGANGAGFIPFTIHPLQATNAFYQPYSFTKLDIGSGNFGKMDISSIDGGQGWSADMTSGCNCSTSVGQFYGSIPGVDGIFGAFSTRASADPFAIMAVSADLGSGNANHGETIIGFVGIEIMSVTGNNGNWTITVENVPVDSGGSGSSTTNTPFAFGRFLVQ